VTHIFGVVGNHNAATLLSATSCTLKTKHDPFHVKTKVLFSRKSAHAALNNLTDDKGKDSFLTTLNP
jgi:hypothetical protein